MVKITKKYLEKLGFDVEKQNDEYCISQYTPAGEDWQLYFTKLKDIKEYAENYDPNEDFEMWVEAKKSGVRGVPDYSELWEDQLWKQELLNNLI